MIVLNYIPKIQAIDKAVALLAQLQQSERPVSVVSIVNIQAKNRISSCQMLFRLLGGVSDRVFVIGDTPLHREALDVLKADGRGHELLPLPEESELAAYARDVLKRGWEASVTPRNQDRRPALLLPLTGDSHRLGAALAAQAPALGLALVAYFKSIHDEGAGLTTVLHDEAAGPSPAHGPFYKRWLRGTRRARRSRAAVEKGAIPGKPDGRLADAILVFNEAHANVLREDGYPPDKLFSIGYPLLYPEWKSLVKSAVDAEGPGPEATNRVVLFTRGETPGRPPEANVVPHATLKVILDDIFDTLDRVRDRYEVRVKPHPIQDLDVLKEMLAGRANVQIVFDPPSVLAASSDLAISTYSSTVLDALVFGVPSIEYLIENDFFRKKHPTGSPFPALGALRANNRTEFETCIRQVTDPGYRAPDLASALEHRMDLSIFDRL